MSTPQLWKTFALHWKLFPFNKYYPAIFDIKRSRIVVNNAKALRHWLLHFFVATFFTVLSSLILIFYFRVPNSADENPGFVMFIFVFIGCVGLMSTFLHLVIAANVSDAVSGWNHFAILEKMVDKGNEFLKIIKNKINCYNERNQGVKQGTLFVCTHVNTIRGNLRQF